VCAPVHDNNLTGVCGLLTVSSFSSFLSFFSLASYIPPTTNFGNAAEHAEKDVKMKRRQQVTYNVT
jgi:hypothetical protein